MAQSQNDHIILPKATLLRFTDDCSNMCSSLNFSSPNKCEITKHYPRHFHTGKDYFDKAVDNKMKKVESLIGDWNKRLLSAVEKDDASDIDFIKLKEFAIQLITLQFHRCVMADAVLRSKFIKYKQNEYNEKSCECFRRGIAPPSNFLRLKQAFEKAKDKPEVFIKFFQEKYLMNGNQSIEDSYQDFETVILSIPSTVTASFLLPPQHFVGIDAVARIVLGPQLAIGLYPKGIGYANSIYKLTKDEATDLVPRSIESALEMSDTDYRQIIGNNSYLFEIKKQIEMFRSQLHEINNTSILQLNVEETMWDSRLIWTIITIRYMKPLCTGVILNVRDLSNGFKTNIREWKSKFKEYHYNVAVLSDNIIEEFSDIPIYTKADAAVEYLRNIQ